MGRRPRTTAGGRRLPARMAAPLVLVVLVAVTVRAALYRSSLAAFIAERVEVASPLNAWKRGEGRAGPGWAAVVARARSVASAAPSCFTPCSASTNSSQKFPSDNGDFLNLPQSVRLGLQTARSTGPFSPDRTRLEEAPLWQEQICCPSALLDQKPFGASCDLLLQLPANKRTRSASFLSL